LKEQYKWRFELFFVYSDRIRTIQKARQHVDQDMDMEKALRFYGESYISLFPRTAHATFMRAMKEGYASKPTKGTIAELPGSKTIEYIENNWRVIDTYVVTPQSPYSGGMTMLYYGPLPVFMMQYIGYYTEEAIPCLKAALKANYDVNKFYGGRGPDIFQHEGFIYTNGAEGDFFTYSRASERIFNPNGEQVGWHHCHSVYMLEQP